MDNRLKKSVAASLAHAIDKDGISSAVEEFSSFKNSKYYHPVVESEMNNLGYQLLQTKKIREAIGVFELNVAAFPNSWNAFDSLGEAYMGDGNKLLAIKNYEKSLALNPGNTYGIDALKKLREPLNFLENNIFIIFQYLHLIIVRPLTIRRNNEIIEKDIY